MDRLIYTALSGLSARQRETLVTANNLANAGVPGFRREISVQESRYLAAARAADGQHNARAQTGAPSLSTPGLPGKVAATGRGMDVALAGEAWLAVQGPRVGGEVKEAYTRRGDLMLTPTGLVTNGDGRVMLGTNGVPLSAPPGSKLVIAADGSITADGPDGPQVIGRLKMVDGRTLTARDKAGDSIFMPEAPLPASPTARLEPGALEAANVSTAQALVELVEEQRGFEVSTRLVKLAQEMDEAGSRLMRLES